MADEAKIEAQSAIVPVRWIEPKKDAMVTQMITNPFLVIRLAKGAYDQIEVVDQSGSRRVVVGTSKE
jgi:hypothetical protein